MGIEEVVANAGYWGILLMVPFATLFMWARSKQADAITDAEVGRGVLKIATNAIERNSALEDQRTKLAADVADLTRRVVNLELDLSYAQRDNREQAKKITELTDEVRDLRLRLSSEYERAEKAERENAELRLRIVELETQVKGLEARLAVMVRDRNEAIRAEITLIDESGRNDV